MFFIISVAQKHSRILQGASVRIRNHEACKRQHGKHANGEYRVNNHTVCAGVSYSKHLFAFFIDCFCS